MTEQLEIPAQKRTVFGKKVRRLRSSGWIPATMYGHNLSSQSLQVEQAALEQAMRRAGTSSLLRVKVGRGAPAQALIKQVQVDPVRGTVLHVDFYQVAAREKLKAIVPLRFVGEAPVAGTQDVAIMRLMDEVAVECYPSDLPPALEVNLSQLVGSDSIIRVSDLKLPPGVTLHTQADDVVVSVAETAREAEEAAVAEEVEQAVEEREAAEQAGETQEPAA